MNGRSLYGVFVRAIGLYYMVWSLEYFVMPTYWHISGDSPGVSAWSLRSNIIAGFRRIVIGFLLVRFAEPIVRFTYRDRDNSCPKRGVENMPPENEN